MRKVSYEPKSAMVVPNFVFNETILAMNPGWAPKNDIWSFLAMVWIFVRQMWLNWTFGIGIYRPIRFFLKPNTHLNIVTIFPEIQPRRDDFDSTFKFIGPCVSEQARQFEIRMDEKLKAVVDLFKPRGELDQSTSYSDLKLVYVSLGTVFNHNLFVFDEV